MASKTPETLVITNFAGRLSRIVNGEINSGFAKFTNSFGYDPFTKPMNLTWLEQPSSIASFGTSSSVITRATTRFEGDTTFVYAVDQSGTAYRIQPNSITNPNLDSVLGVGSVKANGNTYQHDGSIDFFGTPGGMFVGGDKGVVRVPITSVITGEFGGESFIGNANQYVTNVNRPVVPFGANLIFGNGPTIGAISASNTVVSSIIGVAIGPSGTAQNIYSELNPPFPTGNNVQDLDVSQDYNYLLATASENTSEDLTTVASDRQNAAATRGSIFKWNGVDTAATAGTAMPSQNLTALQTYLQQTMLFANDAFGLAFGDATSKILSLQKNKSPTSQATGVNGNFVHWMAPEVSPDSQDINGSLYYFGSLDYENPAGLWRLLRHSTSLSNGFVYQVPVNLIVNDRYQTTNVAITSVVTLGHGKHYFSTLEVNNTTTRGYLYRFLVTPSGTGTPQAGVYETQTQLFSKRKSIKQVRVYTEPTATGNGFQLDLIGGDGNVITNGTFNYTYTAGDDLYTLKGPMERINFDPNTVNTFALGVRITNTGTTNMTIKKMEVDIDDGGR